MKLISTTIRTSTANVVSEIHQASTLLLAWRSSSPRLGVGLGTPRLRKSRLVSSTMAPETRNGKNVMTGVKVFGKMCLEMIVQLLGKIVSGHDTGIGGAPTVDVHPGDGGSIDWGSL